MNTKDVISANLPVLRELRGKMSQAALAQAGGVSKRTIARLEAGEVADPGIELLQCLAAALGVPLAALVESALVVERVALPRTLCAKVRDAEGWTRMVAALR